MCDHGCHNKIDSVGGAGIGSMIVFDRPFGP